MVRRVNGVRQVWQKHLGRWKPVLEDNQLASEFVEEAIESYQTNPGAAEAAFENIELSTFEGGLESTPLLGGGAAAASGGVSTSTAVGGVLVGATVVGGIVTAIVKSSEDRNDPIVTLPDHKFLGPGNDDDDETPIDTDDIISKHHDSDYSKARTQEDVQIADDVAIEQFSKDVFETGNIHSALGAVGLGTKRVIERITGVKYPANLPSSSSAGMGLTRIKRAPGKYPIYNDPRRHPDFPKRDDHTAASFKSRVKYIWNAWNVARQNHGLVRVDPPGRLGIDTTMRPPLNRGTGRSEERRVGKECRL